MKIYAGKKQYKIDLSKYNFVNPRLLHYSIERTEYLIEDGSFVGIVGVYVYRDNSVQGGYFGHLKIIYGWFGKNFVAKSIRFVQANIED